MRGTGATHNLFAVSAALSEAGINQMQSMDLGLRLSIDDVANLVPRRESNADEANGLEEANYIYDNGNTAQLSMNFKRAQPHHFAFLYAFGLGSCVTSAAGSGQLHTITPVSNAVDLNRELPSFTGMQRLGLTVLKRKMASFFVDQVEANFPADGWVNIKGSLQATGKHEDNVVAETVAATEDATSLILAANAVHGATAEERLDSIHQVRVNLSGVWTEVDYSAVSDATPAEITISAPGVATDTVDYEVLYRADEGGNWDFPACMEQSSLRVSEMQFTLGGSWDGAAFSGGRVISSEIQNLTHTLTNDTKVAFLPGAGGSHASDHQRRRSQKISMERKFRDYILQQHLTTNQTLGCRLICQGAEFDTGHNYQVEIIFPMLAALDAPLSVTDRKLRETADLQVLEDATHGSVIVMVKETDRAAGYAQ